MEIDYNNSERDTQLAQRDNQIENQRENQRENSSMDNLEDPRRGATYPSQNQDFLQWLFSFRKEAIIPLRNIWRGREFNFNTQTWEQSKSQLRIMNEDGITWSISLIESYLSPVYIVSDFDERSYNFTMREAARFIWNSLASRFGEFGMKKLDIPRVAEEIESKIRAILLGAKDNGYRDFFSTQHQIVEQKQISDQNYRPRSGVFQTMASMFRKQEGRY